MSRRILHPTAVRSSFVIAIGVRTFVPRGLAITNCPREWYQFQVTDLEALVPQIRPSMRALSHAQVCANSSLRSVNKNLPLESIFAFFIIKLVTVNLTFAFALVGTSVMVAPITSWLRAKQRIIPLVRLIGYVVIIGQCNARAPATSHALATAIALVPRWAFSCNKRDKISEFSNWLGGSGWGKSQHVLVLD